MRTIAFLLSLVILTELPAQAPLLDSTYFKFGTRLDSEKYIYQSPTEFTITKRPLNPDIAGSREVSLYKDSLLHEVFSYDKFNNLKSKRQILYDSRNRVISSSTKFGNDFNLSIYTYKDSSDNLTLSHDLKIKSSKVVNEILRRTEYDDQNRSLNGYYLRIENATDTVGSILSNYKYYTNGVRKYKTVVNIGTPLINQGYALNHFLEKFGKKDTSFVNERVRYWYIDSTFREDLHSQTYDWGVEEKYTSYGKITYRNTAFEGIYQTSQWVGDSLIITKYRSHSGNGTFEDYRSHIKNDFQLISRIAHIFNQFGQPLIELGYTRNFLGNNKRPYLKEYFYQKSNSTTSSKVQPKITVISELDHTLLYYDLSGKVVTQPYSVCQLIEIDLANNTSQRILFIPD